MIHGISKRVCGGLTFMPCRITSTGSDRPVQDKSEEVNSPQAIRAHSHAADFSWLLAVDLVATWGRNRLLRPVTRWTPYHSF